MKRNQWMCDKCYAINDFEHKTCYDCGALMPYEELEQYIKQQKAKIK